MRYWIFLKSDNRRRVIACALLVAGGCGGPQTADVSGTVTLGGDPVGPGSVIFAPDDTRGTSGPSSIGHFGPDGQFTLTMPGGRTGAVVGHHRVAIHAGGSETFAEEAVSTQRTTIPTRYANPQQSGLAAEVQSGSNTLQFDLEP